MALAGVAPEVTPPKPHRTGGFMIRYTGIDLHKQSAVSCFVSEKGKVIERPSCEVTREDLLLFARNYLKPEDRIALEATTNTWAVVRLLRPFVSSITVSNPMKTKAIAEGKCKTDKVDAEVLAQLLRSEFLPGIWIPDEATIRLRSLTGRRGSLVHDQTTIKCRIHSVLHQRLMRPPVKNIFGPVGRAWLRKVDIDEDGRLAIDSELRLLEAVEREIGELDLRLSRLGYSDARLKLLMTIPGVSLNVGMSLLAAWGDISRFETAGKAAAYLGLVPRTHQSADKCYHGPITKQGNTNARWMLIQAAQHLGQDPGPLGNFYRKKAKQKCHNVAVVAAAHKVARIAWLMLKNNEPYRYALPRTTETKLAKLRVAASGEKRKGGLAKGSSRPKAYGTGQGTRLVPSLSTVYTAEGLPPPTPPADLPPGERKFLRSQRLIGHVSDLHKPKRIPRNSSSS
jgi:transposase